MTAFESGTPFTPGPRHGRVQAPRERQPEDYEDPFVDEEEDDDIDDVELPEE